MDVPIWWVDFGVCDLRGVELREIDPQSMCFVVIIDCKMTNNNIATGTYTTTVVSSKQDCGKKNVNQPPCVQPGRLFARHSGIQPLLRYPSM